MIGIGPEFGECCRRIDVPEDFQGVRPRITKHLVKQQIVFETDAACLDDNIGLGRSAADGLQRADRAFVDHDLAPVRRIHVAVLLPIIDIGFVEGNVISPLRQRPQQAAIIGGSAIPIGGDEA